MRKLLFVPFGVAGGAVGGAVAKRAFDGVWGLIDEHDPPRSKEQMAPWGRLILAAALQGAIFAATKSAADHGSRKAFFRLTGLWPGDTEPKEATKR